MTPTTIAIVNLLLALIVIAPVAAVLRLAHRLPVVAPTHDEKWGRGGDPWVGSDPLPLQQVVRHERERASALAA
jgi:hypothetical protein